MEAYPIHDVERLTGIKAHTLRIWEKRYNILIPHRTATNIRYYDDDQLRKLLNISTLLEQGYKISTLSSFSDAKINELIAGLKDVSVDDGLCSAYVNELTGAMLAFNELLFDKISSVVITRFGIYDAMVKVIYPFMYKTGVLWSTSSVIPAQEHFASNIIKRKLMAAVDGIVLPQEKNKKFLLFLPPGEWHEIGLLFADYVIRHAGYHSTYLGQNVPYSNVEIAISKVEPDKLVTFIMPGNNVTNTINQLTDIAIKHPGIKILICTSNDILSEDLPSNIDHLRVPSNIFNYL